MNLLTKKGISAWGSFRNLGSVWNNKTNPTGDRANVWTIESFRVMSFFSTNCVKSVFTLCKDALVNQLNMIVGRSLANQWTECSAEKQEPMFICCIESVNCCYAFVPACWFSEDVFRWVTYLTNWYVFMVGCESKSLRCWSVTLLLRRVKLISFVKLISRDQLLKLQLSKWTSNSIACLFTIHNLK